MTVVNVALQKEATELRKQLDSALAVTVQSPERQPCDESCTTASNTPTHISQVAQSDTAVSHPSGGHLSKTSVNQSVTGGHQSVTGGQQIMTQLSHAELLLQYEILLQEKRELCVRLDEKTTESKELTEKLEKTQEQVTVSKDDNDRLKMAESADTMCDKCQQLKQQLESERTRPDERFLELQTHYNIVLAERTQLVSELDSHKMLTAECSADGEALQMAQVECEKLTQDVAGLRQELETEVGGETPAHV